MDGNDEVCNSCEPSKQGAAEPEPIKPFRITLAPPVKQPNFAPKHGPANFVHVRPGQSLESLRSLIQSRQSAYSSLSKRGADSNKGLLNFNVSFFTCLSIQAVALKHPSCFVTDWKIATLGPLFLIPRQGTNTKSTGSQLGQTADIFSASVTEEPDFSLNLTEMSPMMDERKFKTIPETGSFSPLEDSLFSNASDLFGSEEGSGFE